MWHEIILAPEAAQDLGKLGAYERAQVKSALETHLRFEPAKASKSRIKQLKGLTQPQFRLRVDEVRIFYDIAGNRVEVLAIVTKDQAQEWLDRKGKKI